MNAPTIADPVLAEINGAAHLRAALESLRDTSPLDIAEEIDPGVMLETYRRFVRRTVSVALIKSEGAA